MPSKITYEQEPNPRPSVVSEQDIEEEFIEKLKDLKYTDRPDIRDRAALEANFRQKFEALNRVRLTDAEFARLLDDLVSPDVFKNSVRLREKNDFNRDDGTPLSYTLVNIRDWCKNDFEVVHQLRINTDYSHHRYDVLLVINGVPVAQVELKTLSVSPRRAMEQIVDYKADPGNGYTRTLLCFVQLFIVSNRTETFYFANNNARHFAFNADEQFLPVYRFADRANKPITHLAEFADAFLQKCDLGRMISRYMVLIQSEQKLLMMRPYQIYAVQSIVDCIDQNNGNGYIWHTTGSGKTLTSFKAATLLKDNPAIDKCLFVVDRKDLDRQTREEFNRFQEGCVEENTNTETLVRRLLSDDRADKVIVTTIQKLGLALDGTNKRNYRERLAPLSAKRLVFIFDECHRSQFGDNHKAIKEFFPRSQLFGFTGTPIFEANATRVQIAGEEKTLRTTADLFQRELHAYTITHAIEDKNVLRFHVDYYKPAGEDAAQPGRILEKKAVVKAILDNHNAATHARRFNALLATSSINEAIEYHGLFQSIQTERLAADPAFVPLKVACVFSPPAEGNADVRQIQEDLPQEKADNEQDPEGKKAALRTIIDAYNTRYGTAHAVGEFDLYYQDVQKRIKDQQFPNADLPRKGAEKIDVTIVVDMLLTGFDSKFLNTLYVDKNLKHHGLIQAFSRTNRVLNATKPHGQILDFRAQRDAVDAAVTLFSGVENKSKAREIWLVDPAPKVVEKLKAALGQLGDFMRSQGLAARPEDVPALRGDEARAAFIERFREVQRLKTQLTNDWDMLRETNPAKMPKFDAIVANPPFSLRWEPTDTLGEDVRFKNHGIAPKSAADFAFLLHGFHYLKDQGVMAIILPHGVLFRGGAEERIRTKLLKDGHIDTVIGLPANLFYSTGIPVCILVLKKCKKPDDVLFINAAEHFEKGKRQNILTEEHIDKIVETYRDRPDQIDRYAKRVSMERIAEEGYNLNISRYISTATAEEEIDLEKTHADLVAIEERIRVAATKHNAFLRELGLPPLPHGESVGKS